MPKETKRLKLPLPLGNENVTRESINGIFEKIDAGVATQADLDTLREAVSKMDIPDASLTQKGKVQLSSKTDGTSETMAATEKAVSDARVAAETNAKQQSEDYTNRKFDSVLENPPNLLMNPTGQLGLNYWRAFGSGSWGVRSSVLGSYFYISGSLTQTTYLESFPIKEADLLESTVNLSVEFNTFGSTGKLYVELLDQAGNTISQLFSETNREWHQKNVSLVLGQVSILYVRLVCTEGTVQGIRGFRKVMLYKGGIEVPFNNFSDMRALNNREANFLSENVYVNAENGNDAGRGTISSPFKTLGRAIKACASWNNNWFIINLAKGTYAASSISNFKSDDPLGTGIGRIRIVGTDSQKSVITGMTNIDSNYNRIVFDNIQFGNADFSAIFASSNSFLEIRNCTFLGASGIVALNIHQTNALIENCSFSNFQTVMNVGSFSRVVSRENTGSANTIGLIATVGGVICRSGTQPSATTATKVEPGGQII
ncbi:uncharacterized protein DUF1565 [Paenibacillus pabuli]|uniref:Uncharacterized protein DUF1565 n=1 Tax=Paenibacillus pabuli TaxID=1472 RepID=A0ABX9BH35_9BACL|nr:tail fiber protein [Paenibacillus pabuli]RAI92391.1 uncharacterized protein DUF1565 [Paenibacillus pabuli]